MLGPLAECVIDKLVTDFPEKFRKVVPETRHCAQSALDQELSENLIVDYRRKASYYECITVSAIRTVCSGVSARNLILCRPNVNDRTYFAEITLHVGHINFLHREVTSKSNLSDSLPNQVQKHEANQGSEGHEVSHGQVVRKGRQGDVRTWFEIGSGVPSFDNR